VQIALTTLEEVFLNIAKEAEIEAAGDNKLVLVELEPGLELHVPLGSDTAVNPTTGITYNLVWAQDFAGNLVVDKCERMPLTGDPGPPGQHMPLPGDLGPPA
jgi:hypothetical protein